MTQSHDDNLPAPAGDGRISTTQDNPRHGLRPSGLFAAARGKSPFVDVLEHPKRRMGMLLFVLCVVLPTIAATVYFTLFATDIYTSESKFVVRSPQRAQQTGLIGTLLQNSGFQRAQDDAYTVVDYISSRDALAALDSRTQLRQSYSSEEADIFSRYPGLFEKDSFESFHKYFSKQLVVTHDPVSSVTTVRVRAFDPAIASKANATLLDLSEDLINQINDRGRNDLVRYAQNEVAEAERKITQASQAVASFRNRRAVFDPERQSAIQLQQVSRIEDELVQTRLLLAQIRRLSPENPQIPSLERRSKALETERTAAMGRVAGGSNSFTDKSTDYERLQLDRLFAEKQLASALTNLETARNDARRQQLYLERIAQPSKPDEALEPRRLRNIFATLVVGFVLWGILSMLIAGIREHHD